MTATAARILPTTLKSVTLGAEALRAGGVVAMPTETVYGLAAIAFDEVAVARVFAAKERPTFDPLIVHVADDPETRRDPVAALGALGVVDAEAVPPSVREQAARLAMALWPGPLTLVLPRGRSIPDLVTAGLDTVAVRMPRHPIAQALITRTGFPLAAPSANRFGRISPTSAEDVLAELGDRIELILDGGRCEIGLESTVLALPASGRPLLLRPGGVARETIEALVGPVETAQTAGRSSSGGEAAVAPGMLASHYAPVKPLTLLPRAVFGCVVEDFPSVVEGALGVLLQSGDPAPAAAHLGALLGRPVIVRSLSQGGDLAEAARHLFACLRELDAAPVVALFAEPCSDERGLGHAIADRLRRAAAR